LKEESFFSPAMLSVLAFHEFINSTSFFSKFIHVRATACPQSVSARVKKVLISPAEHSLYILLFPLKATYNGHTCLNLPARNPNISGYGLEVQLSKAVHVILKTNGFPLTVPLTPFCLNFSKATSR